MNKKYLPSALILYLNYFIHGIGCSILSQQVVKELLAEQWGMSDVMGVTAVAAALGLGRLISLLRDLLRRYRILTEYDYRICGGSPRRYRELIP